MGSFLFALPAPAKVSNTMGTSPADSFVVGPLVLATCMTNTLITVRSTQQSGFKAKGLQYSTYIVARYRHIHASIPDHLSF